MTRLCLLLLTLLFSLSGQVMGTNSDFGRSSLAAKITAPLYRAVMNAPKPDTPPHIPRQPPSLVDPLQTTPQGAAATPRQATVSPRGMPGIQLTVSDSPRSLCGKYELKNGFAHSHPPPSRHSTTGLTGGLDRSRRNGRDRGLCGLLSADIRSTLPGATARHDDTEGAGGIGCHAGTEAVDEAQGRAYGEGVRQIPRRKRNHRWPALP